tara:strand:+ start:12574 stop:13440 length:867 start_codon:yes stop_codon:yes gene_type:complete
MSGLNGWIKLHRQLLDHWVAEDPEFMAAWVRMTLLANHSDNKTVINGQLIELKRGQFIFGLDAFSRQAGISLSKLRRLMKLLENDRLIDRQKTNKYSIVSIVSYEKYQSSDSQNDSQTTVKRQADDRQTTGKPTAPKEVKNVKNVKNVKKKDTTKTHVFSDDDLAFANFMFETIANDLPDFKKPNLETWANTIRLMRDRDNREHDQMRAIFLFARASDFWAANVMSPEKLRKHFDRLCQQCSQKPSASVSKFQTREERNAEAIEKRNAILFGDKPQEKIIQGEVIDHV